VSGDHIEEEPMTAVLHSVDPRLLERDDLTIDDLTDLPDNLHYELIEGRLILTPHAKSIHNVIGRRAAEAIEEFAPRGFTADQEQCIRRNRRNELQPDVMALRISGADRSPVLPESVVLVVEVISPSSKIRDRQEKLALYAELGIPHYWIIDPLADRVTLAEFRLEPSGYRRLLETDQEVTLEEPWKIRLDLPALTRRRDFFRDEAEPGL
jgi:Uma2 family endonuclease